MKHLALIIVAVLVTTACPPSQPLEQTARDTAATAKGYLDSAKQQHPECSATPPAQSTQCEIISRGVGVKDALIDAINVYCSSPAYDTGGGPCVPVKSAQGSLQAALNNLNQILADVKSVAGQ